MITHQYKLTTFLASLLFILTTKCYGQVENTKTSYVDLKTLSLTSTTWDNIDKCKPCILEVFDKNGIRLTKAVQFTDCLVGFYNEYYPNGKLKITGQYRENNTGSWNNIYDRGYCLSETGEWIFYNEKGIVATREFWLNGVFLREQPERSFNDVWKVELMLNNKILDKNTPITRADIPKLKTIPYFKNKSKNGVNLTDTLSISAIGRREFKVKLTQPDNSALDIEKVMEKNGFKKTDKAYFFLIVYNNRKQVGSFQITTH